MEVGAVFSFDTGTDNSLGKRATSSIYLSMYNSSFSKASVLVALVAMYAFYLKHYVYTGAQARRGRIELDRTVGSLALFALCFCLMYVKSPPEPLPSSSHLKVWLY